MSWLRYTVAYDLEIKENKNIFSLYVCITLIDVSCGYRYQPGISEYRRAIPDRPTVVTNVAGKCMLCLLQ